MQFLITAYDSEDDGTLEKRIESRADHIAMITKYKESGNIIIGAAILDDDNKMIGSTIIADFPDENALHIWLSEEPYIINDIWEEVAVTKCAISPVFV